MAREARSRTRSATLAIGLLATLLLVPVAYPHSGALEAPPSPESPHVGSVSVSHGAPRPTGGTSMLTPVDAAPADRPAVAGINPLSGYSREPAPMGIADFGVTGPSHVPYQYTTSAFEATARIDSMNVVVNGGGSPEEVTAFELNAMVVFQEGGTNYTYWIQNGLHVNTSSREFTIGGAYVWNFSVAGAHLAAGELHGAAGSALASDTYYYIPGCNGLPGQCTTLSWPDTITGRINTSLSGGVPMVTYQYDLGLGWVTYDQVTFPHLVGASVTGFTVNGFRATPYAATEFYDAEWDWVAAGGGLSMVDHGSNLSMALEYWNGRNYQAVPCAWDFGGDTGETSQNVSVALATPGTEGGLAAQVSSGAGTLGLLYNASERGFLNVSTPTTANGTLSVGGAKLAYSGGGVNLTMATGTYPVALVGYSNATAAAAVLAGQTARIVLSGAGETKFIETGLPNGTAWGLAVNATPYTGVSATLVAHLPNGSFELVLDRVPGFIVASPPPAVLTVPSPAPIRVAFAPFTFEVPFTEAGLDRGTAWWVNASGTLVQGTSPTLRVPLANGTTDYTVGSEYRFLAVPASGSVDVFDGAFAPVSVEFTYRFAFIVGTVSPSDATVTLNGTLVALSDGGFNVSVLPGVYLLNASAPGHESKSIEVTTTPGNGTEEVITLTPTPATPPSSSTPSNSVPTFEYVGIGVALLAVIALVGFLLLRRGRGKV